MIGSRNMANKSEVAGNEAGDVDARYRKERQETCRRRAQPGQEARRLMAAHQADISLELRGTSARFRS